MLYTWKISPKFCPLQGHHNLLILQIASESAAAKSPKKVYFKWKEDDSNKIKQQWWMNVIQTKKMSNESATFDFLLQKILYWLKVNIVCSQITEKTMPTFFLSY